MLAHDFLTLLLVNMSAGMFVLAIFLLRGIDRPDQGTFVPPLLIAGLVAAIGGFFLLFRWPLPGAYNMAFGELSVLLGMLLAGASLAIGKRMGLMGLGLYALFAGLAAVVLGAKAYDLYAHHSVAFTAAPLLTFAGFVGSGLAAVLAGGAVIFRARVLAVLAGLMLLACSGLWAFVGYGSYWKHMDSMLK